MVFKHNYGRTLGYNVRESALRAVLRWSGTLTRSVVGGLEFWIVVGLTTALTILIDLGVFEVPDMIATKDMASLMGPVLGLAIFTTIYYNGQAFARYEVYYKYCMNVDTAIKQFVSEMLTDFAFDPALRKHIVKSAKYVLASVFIFHVNAANQNGCALDEGWALITRKGLLSEGELNFVRTFPGSNILLLQYWAQVVADDAVAYASVKAKYSPPERASITGRIHGQIETISHACANLLNLRNLPIPFPYFHLMQANIFFSLLTAGFCCCLFASRTSSSTYCAAVLPFTVIAFVLLGMRQLAYELADPFGTDDVDFPAADFTRHIYDHVATLLAAELRLDPTASLEAVEFDSRHVLQPCNWEDAKLADSVNMKKFHAAEAALTRSGARIWVHPESSSSGQQLAAWLGGDHEVQGNEIALPSEATSGDTPAPKKPAAVAAARPASASTVELVQGVNEKLKTLAELLDRIPQVLTQAVKKSAARPGGGQYR